MNQNPFHKAERTQAYLKLGIAGPSGSGKTYSALRLATGLIQALNKNKRIAFLDTENNSASLYSEEFDFDVLSISPPFHDQKFIDGIYAAVGAGYGLAIIDSASHFWQGILEYKSAIDARGGNSYTNWNAATAKFNTIMHAILQSQIHIICCMRSKMDYVLEENEKGKQVPHKLGLAPIMRDSIEYEFTTVFDVGMDHTVTTAKDRSKLFIDQKFQVTEETGVKLLTWLSTAKATPTMNIAVIKQDLGSEHPVSKAPSEIGLTDEGVAPPTFVSENLNLRTISAISAEEVKKETEDLLEKQPPAKIVKMPTPDEQVEPQLEKSINIIQIQKLEELVEKYEPCTTELFLKNKYIEEGENFRDADPIKIQRILDNPKPLVTKLVSMKKIADRSRSANTERPANQDPDWTVPGKGDDDFPA